eukprot:scaffold5705_cov122-Isochrysis_galbana.AAC.4
MRRRSTAPLPRRASHRVPSAQRCRRARQAPALPEKSAQEMAREGFAQARRMGRAACTAEAREAACAGAGVPA